MTSVEVFGYAVREEQSRNWRNPEVTLSDNRCFARYPSMRAIRCIRDPHGSQHRHLAADGMQW